MSRAYIIVHERGFAYRTIPKEDHRGYGALFAVYAAAPHRDMRGVPNSATLFPSVKAARRAIAAECRWLQRTYGAVAAQRFADCVRLVPVEQAELFPAASDGPR